MVKEDAATPKQREGQGGEDECVEPPPFDVGDLHTKALLRLLRAHHSDQSLTYAELSDEIGIGQKTKRWQCEAWKDLKSNDYLAGGGKVPIALTAKGLQLATSLADDDELEEYKKPMTNEEHHEKIRKKLERIEKARRYGPKIFDYMLDTHKSNPRTKHDIASHFDTLADSHGFFYGFQALRKMKLVAPVDGPAKSSGKRKEREGEETNGDDDYSEKATKKSTKVYKSKKKRQGGKMWRLTEKAWLTTEP
jgi:hypothetical protein